MGSRRTADGAPPSATVVTASCLEVAQEAIVGADGVDDGGDASPLWVA
jgi:hypothetical protein